MLPSRVEGATRSCETPSGYVGVAVGVVRLRLLSSLLGVATFPLQMVGFSAEKEGFEPSIPRYSE